MWGMARQCSLLVWCYVLVQWPMASVRLCPNTTSNFSILMFWDGSLTYHTYHYLWSYLLVWFPIRLHLTYTYVLSCLTSLVWWTASKQPLIVIDIDTIVHWLSQNISDDGPEKGLFNDPKKKRLILYTATYQLGIEVQSLWYQPRLVTLFKSTWNWSSCASTIAHNN